MPWVVIVLSRARSSRILHKKQLWQTLIIMIIFQYVMGNLATVSYRRHRVPPAARTDESLANGSQPASSSTSTGLRNISETYDVGDK